MLAVTAAVVAPSGRGHVADFVFVAPVRHGRGDRGRDALQPGTVGAPVAPATDRGAGDDPPPPPIRRPPRARPEPRHRPATVGGAVAAGAGSATSVVPTLRQPPAPTHTAAQVLWIGDSVAADLAPALTAAFAVRRRHLDRLRR